MMKILESLPVCLPLGDALEEAKRLRREQELVAQRVRDELYRESHRDERNRQSRECKARKKLKLQAVATT